MNLAIRTPMPWPQRGIIVELPPAATAVLLFLGYFAAAALPLSTFGVNAPIWISNAIAVVVLLRSKPATWLFLLGIAATANFSAVTFFGGYGPFIGLGVTTCHILEISLIIGALHGVKWLDLPFGSLRRTGLLVLICMLAPVLSSACGATLLWLAEATPFFSGWITWYVASTFGLLITVPFLLNWTNRALLSNMSAFSLLEIAFVTGLAAAAGYSDFTYGLTPGLLLAFPFLQLATFRQGFLGATAGAMALTFVVTWLTYNGQGPIAAIPHAAFVTRTELVQFYIAIILLSTIPMASILEQRRALRGKLNKTLSMLSVQDGRFQAALDNMTQGLCMFDAQHCLVVHNQRFSAMFGAPEPGAVGDGLLGGQYPDQMFSPPDSRYHSSPNSCSDPGESTHELPDGRVIQVSRQRTADEGWVATYEDVTERRRAQEQLSRLARHDALTGLPNRLMFHEHMGDVLVPGQRHDSIAVLCLDLDGFTHWSAICTP